MHDQAPRPFGAWMKDPSTFFAPTNDLDDEIVPHFYRPHPNHLSQRQIDQPPSLTTHSTCD